MRYYSTSSSARHASALASSLAALGLVAVVAASGGAFAQETPPPGGPPPATPAPGTQAPGATQPPGAAPTSPPVATPPTAVPPAGFPTPGSTTQVAPPPPTIPAGPTLELPIRDPFRPAAIFDLRPGIMVSEEYSDNFTRVRTNKQDNFRTSVSPGANLFINGAFTRGQLGYRLSGTHDTTDGEFNIFHSFSGLLSWQASPRLTLTATDTLTRSDDRTEGDRLLTRQDRGVFTSNSFSLASDYLIDRVATRQYYRNGTFFEEDELRTISHTLGTSASVAIYQLNSVTAGYEYLLSETDDSTLRGHRFSGSYSRQLNLFTSAGVSGSYALRTRSTANTENDFTTWTVSLFNNYTLPPRLTLSGSIGISRLESEAGTSRTSFFTASALSYAFARATARLGVESGFSETFADGAEDVGVVETRGITASLSYPFTPFINGTARGFYRQNEFTDVGAGTQAADREFDVWGLALTFSVQLLRNLTMGLDLSHNERLSDDRARSFAENRARVSFSAGF